MAFRLHRWLGISLVNLLIVSIIGVILRYKIAYSLPFFDQKHLLHGHSHFAFAGWITQALMALMVAWLIKQNNQTNIKKYQYLLYGNLLSAYGMLIAFPIQGYGFYSILFSTTSIFVAYIFAIVFWLDVNKIKSKSPSHNWFRAALIFNAVSSAGAFSLAGMMATKTIEQNWYLAAIYFFLHFQYNGWFFFGCMGLLYDKLSAQTFNTKKLNTIFWMFALACVPAYFLSALWLNIHLSLYIIVIVAALLQLGGWIWLVSILKNKWSQLTKQVPNLAKWLIGLSGVALTLKLLLQAGSVIPSLSNLAFGFRPIVIGYLHLVLLGVITLFLIGYQVACGFLYRSRLMVAGILIFTAGIIVNEILLMMAGITALETISIPYINEMLLGAAIILFTGLLLLSISQYHKKSAAEIMESL